MSASRVVGQDERARKNASRYVLEYVRRGAIVAPDACEVCELPVQVSASRAAARLIPWHPDPALRREVLWLCWDCRKTVPHRGEAVRLRWVWPGLTSVRSRKRAIVGSFEPGMAPVVGESVPRGLRDAALTRALIGSLTDSQRERLFGEGCRLLPDWWPSGNAEIDRLLRQWAFDERASRSDAWRESVGREVTPVARGNRSQREVMRGVQVSSGPSLRGDYDSEGAFSAIDAAMARLEAAFAEFDVVNERVIEAVSTVNGSGFTVKRKP